MDHIASSAQSVGFALILVAGATRTGQAQLPSPTEDKSWSRLAVVELVDKNVQAKRLAGELAAAGGALRVLVGNLAWVDLPPEADAAFLQKRGVRHIHRESWAGPAAPMLEKSTSDLLGMYRSGAAFEKPPEGADPILGDAFLEGPTPPGTEATCGPVDPLAFATWPPTNDRLLGRTHIMQGLVTANVFLAESDASGPENVFDWDSAEISLASSEIQQALIWWSAVAGGWGHSLSFTLQLHTPDQFECQVPGEPTLHTPIAPEYWVETILVPSVMQRLGFVGGTGLCATGRFNESTIGSNDRAFSAFIFDGNNYFSDGAYFAYAYLNGSYLVSLRRPGQYGTNYLNLVVAHEMAHVFRACDEYSQPGYGGCMDCDPCIDGAVPNYNCELGCGSNAECLMRSGFVEGEECCGWTRVMIGLDQAYGAPPILFPVSGQISTWTQVPLRYRTSFGAPRYRVQVARDAAFSQLLVDEVTADTTHVTSALPEGQCLHWRVAAVDGGGNSGLWSGAEPFLVLEGDSLQSVRTDLYVANGPVNAIAQLGGKVYIGGDFTRVAPAVGAMAPIDALTAEPLGFPKVVGRVNALAPDGSGGWYVGGEFTHVGGKPRANIAHIQADYTIVSWNPGANGGVNALALSGGTLYVGGSFTSIGGQSRNWIAALDTGTGNAKPWNANGNGPVHALALSGGRVYAAGEFTQIGAQERHFIAALDPNTGLATPWNPEASHIVRGLVVDGSTVYTGGEFIGIGGQARNYVAALDAGTGLATAWDPQADFFVYTMAVGAGEIYVGGAFSSIGGQPRSYVAALDQTTGLATAWNPGANEEVYALAVSGATVYAGGVFTSIGGHTRPYLAALDASTGLATAWDPSPNSVVGVLTVGGGVVCAGGSFNSVGGQARNRIAALDLASGVVTSWNPNANGRVSALAVSGLTVYAGGTFTSIGGQPRNRIAALDPSGNATPWNPNAGGTGVDAVNALVVSNGKVYAGGIFASIGGQSRICIAALDVATGLATAWNPAASSQVLALAVSGSTVYAGGNFTSIGGQARNYVAALDAATGSATAWNPNAVGTGSYPGVRALAPSGGTVYVAGDFTSIGGQARSYVAALNAATGSATAWDPNPDLPVYALALSGTTVYAGGVFNNIGGGPQRALAALDATTGLATCWFPSAGPTVTSLMTYGMTVFAGGSFTAVAGLPQARLAAIGTSTTPLPVAVSTSESMADFKFTRLSPNPSSGPVRLDYVLPRPGHVRISVYDVHGRLVKRLLDDGRPAGRHETMWDGSRTGAARASGLYFVRIEALGRGVTRRVVVIR